RPDIESAELLEKIRRISLGEYLISSAVLAFCKQKPRPPVPSIEVLDPTPPTCRAKPRPPFSPLKEKPVLTVQELMVVKHLMKGSSNAQIGKALKICEHTVKGHITHLFHKFGLHDRTDLVVTCLRHQVLSFEEGEMDERVLSKQDFRRRNKKYERTKKAG
ncbi:MAG TPA: LuxR C-terminal-related transcriptional regulator, partial [Ktedonobacteraceae bacterium]